MPDVYAAIAEVDVATQERLAVILELRAADPQQRAILDGYLGEIEFPPSARVLEVGCGTGPVTRLLAGRPGVAAAVGVDPSPVFVAKAGELAAGLGNASFEEGMVGRSALARAASTWSSATPCCATFQSRSARSPRRSGCCARVGPWRSATGTTPPPRWRSLRGDPLQDCIEAVKAGFLNDPWLVRRLPALMRSVGFQLLGSHSHGYLQTDQPAYMLTLVDRGADALASSGRIGPELCASLKAEARRRAEAHEFYGFIGFVSFIARKPG
jgi:hypothetical protein